MDIEREGGRGKGRQERGGKHMPQSRVDITCAPSPLYSEGNVIPKWTGEIATLSCSTYPIRVCLLSANNPDTRNDTTRAVDRSIYESKIVKQYDKVNCA